MGGGGENYTPGQPSLYQEMKVTLSQHHLLRWHPSVLDKKGLSTPHLHPASVGFRNIL